MREFYDRLEEGPPIETFEVFRRHCLEREMAGRPKFGHSFHAKDNIAEALEEASDGANYCAFDVLKAARAADHDDIDLALTAAWHFAKAYDSLLHLRAKRHGAP